MPIQISKMIEDAFGASSETATEIKFIRDRLGTQAGVLDKIISDLLRHQGLIEALAVRMRESEDMATTQRSKLATAATLTKQGNTQIFIANEINNASDSTLAQMIGYLTDKKRQSLLDLLNLSGGRNDGNS